MASKPVLSLGLAGPELDAERVRRGRNLSLVCLAQRRLRARSDFLCCACITPANAAGEDHEARVPRHTGVVFSKINAAKSITFDC